MLFGGILSVALSMNDNCNICAGLQERFCCNFSALSPSNGHASVVPCAFAGLLRCAHEEALYQPHLDHGCDYFLLPALVTPIISSLRQIVRR